MVKWLTYIHWLSIAFWISFVVRINKELFEMFLLFYFVETAMGVQINALEKTDHSNYMEAIFGFVFLFYCNKKIK